MEALQLMILTYTETPNFGDAQKFKEELEAVSRKVEKLSQDLTCLNRELDLVDSKMNLNMRHSLLAAPSRSLVSLDNSSLSGGSDTTGYGSQESNSGTDKANDTQDTNEEFAESENFNHDHKPFISDVQSLSINNKNENEEKEFSEEGDGNERLSDCSDEFEDEHMSPSQQYLVALYYYDGAEEGTLSMVEGEEFEVTGEEVDGWIKVKRRQDGSEEGYVPFAFMQML